MAYKHYEGGLFDPGKGPSTPQATPARERFELTPKDREILEALTRRVRVFSIEQLARAWWPDSKRPTARAQARVRALNVGGFVQIQKGAAHPEIQLTAPLTSWTPNDTRPDFGALAYRLQSRWTEHPVMLTCVSATAKAARVFSGHGGRFPREVERTHDLHLTAVYLLYRRQKPEVLGGWQHEDDIRRARGRNVERLPDVILDRALGRLAIEFGGSYGKQKLIAFHEYCEAQSLPYEVW